jgi:NADH-quinone oxidoreductase subunit C
VERSDIHEICRFAKEELGYTYLLDISGVDNFGEDPRFAVVYELYQFERGDWLRLKILVSEDDLNVPTVSDLWATADWHEREAYDMYGLRFTGHPDLRRILMWDGYPFYPLRKDFPLAGRASDMPDVAFSRRAPMEGGPFVTVPTTATTKDREPRSRQIE